MTRSKLNVQRLETRDVPAQFGVPWADSQITLSFAPDGTNVDGAPSELSSMMATGGVPEATWKTEVLRAAETWLQVTGINVGVVADSGLSIGVAGQPQGDKRFGDIRISARPLSPEVVAITVPPGPASGTRAGDIIVNSAKRFNVGGGLATYDFYSVMLQEMGHALGLGNSTNTSSPMYEMYQGVRSGITSADSSNIVALYGARSADSFDAVAGNGNMSGASALSISSSLLPGASTLVAATGDLTTSSDVDFYSFTVPANSAPSITVRLKTDGLSVLQGRLSLFSSSEMILGRQSATSALAGDLKLTLNNAVPGATYYARVDRASSSGATNQFTVGRYSIELNFNPTSPIAEVAATNAFLLDGSTNETAATATSLSASSTGRFQVSAMLEGASDRDYYRLVIPGTVTSSALTTSGSGSLSSGSLSGGSLTADTSLTTSTNSTTTVSAGTLLTVTVRSANPGDGLKPSAVILDASSNPVTGQVIRYADGEFTIQASVAAGLAYFVGVSGLGVSTTNGAYNFDANVKTQATGLTAIATTTLNAADPSDFYTLTVHRGSVMHFVITGSGAASNDFGVRFNVFNSTGAVMIDGFALANRSSSVTKFLKTGEYKIRLLGLARIAGQTLPELPVMVRGFNLSDPIGPGGDDPDAGNGSDGSGGDYGAEENPNGDDQGDDDPGGDPEW
ncbi:MAG: matrixin family metalloprotease [Gemmataceae bacterium]|nr:matrixin family metalloprotease [Gemmataceae bacterium]